MKPWLVVAFLSVMPALLRAQPAPPILGEVITTADADQFYSLRARGGAFLRYDSPFQYFGVAAQATRYAQNSWNGNAPAALLLFRRQQRDTLAGPIAEAGIVRAGGHVRVVGDGSWDFRPNPRTGVELIAAGDLVETQRAIERSIAYSFFAISGERQITPRWTVIALAGHQHFTDGNDRLHLRGRLIWMLVPEEGISAQLRFRQFESDQANVSGAYFNPRRYRQWDGGIFIRKRHGGWVYSGGVAPGQENVIGTRRTTAAIDVSADGPLWNDARIVVHASYNRSAGFAIAERYWYGVASVSIVVPLDHR